VQAGDLFLAETLLYYDSMRKGPEARQEMKKASVTAEPRKPAFRSLHRVAKNVYSKPWLVYQGSEGKITRENLTAALTDPSNLFVELAPMKYKARLQYENVEGESIDETITKIVWVMGHTYKLLEPGLTDEQRKNVMKELERDDLGRFQTPLGYLFGSIESNVAKLCAFVLCTKGRIIGKNAEGYILEPVEPDDLFDVMEGNPFMELNEDMLPMVFEILDAAGLYNIDELKTAEAAEQAAKEERSGNVRKTKPSPAKKGGRGRKPSSKTASSTKKISAKAQ